MIAAGVLWLLALPLQGQAQGTARPAVASPKVAQVDRAIPSDPLHFRAPNGQGRSQEP
jgi:hypothetical protein